MLRARSSVAVVALIAAISLACCAACSARVGIQPTQTLAPNTTTTLLPPTTLAGSVSVTTVAARSLTDITSSLDAAVAARNFCELTAALDQAVPDVTDGNAVIETYESLDAAVKVAVAFRPAELADAWTVVVTGVDEGVAAAKRVAGDLSDPTLRAPFTAGDFEAAMTLVESWSDTHCSPG